jgi:ubiquinone/menaquinone biosynthesis C-methylase UbiE
MVFQCAWALLLHRHSGEDDVVFGTVSSGRPPELEGVEEAVGLYIRTLPVRSRLHGGESVLEMGACHGWASTILKQCHPGCTVVVADLLADALAHAARWEELFEVSLDGKWACHCRNLPFADAQFDRIFTFASFHHFGIGNDYRGALSEMLRVLKPGGKIVLLYEPSSPSYLYEQAHRIVNRRRAEEGVDEDLIVPGRLQEEARQLGANASFQYFPESRNRESPSSTVYYALLAFFPWLCRFTVCTVNVTISKALPGP